MKSFLYPARSAGVALWPIDHHMFSYTTSDEKIIHRRTPGGLLCSLDCEDD